LWAHLVNTEEARLRVVASSSIRLPGFNGKGLHGSEFLAYDLAMAIDPVKDSVALGAGRHDTKISEASLVQQVA
jgi:hypothetical protein